MLNYWCITWPGRFKRLTLSFNLRLCLEGGLCASGFPTKTLYVSLMPRPSHSSLFQHPRNIHEQKIILRSSLYSLLQSAVTSTNVRPNVPLSTLFSNTLNICSSLSERPSFAPIQKRQKLRYFIFLFSDIPDKPEYSGSNSTTCPSTSSALNFCVNAKLSASVVTKHLKFATFSKDLRCNFASILLMLHELPLISLPRT